MKHYIGNLSVLCGEYEFSAYVKFKTEGDPGESLERIAATYYEGEPEKEGSAYYFHGGKVAVTPEDWQEIPGEAYNAITIISEA